MEGKKGMGMKQRGSIIMKGIKNKIKKKKRNSIIRGMLDYLKSNSFLYSPLIISSLSSHFSAHLPYLSPPPGLETKETILQKEGNLKEKLLEYMISDAYLYAPFVDDKHPQNSAVKTVIPPPKGHDLLFEAVTKSMLSSKIAWQKKNMTQDTASDKQEDRGSKGVTRERDTSIVSPNTPGLKEVKKQGVHRSYRLPTSGGRGEQAY